MQYIFATAEVVKAAEGAGSELNHRLAILDQALELSKFLSGWEQIKHRKEIRQREIDKNTVEDALMDLSRFTNLRTVSANEIILSAEELEFLCKFKSARRFLIRTITPIDQAIHDLEMLD